VQSRNGLLQALGRISARIRDQFLKLNPKLVLPDGTAIQVGVRYVIECQRTTISSKFSSTRRDGMWTETWSAHWRFLPISSERRGRRRTLDSSSWRFNAPPGCVNPVTMNLQEEMSFGSARATIS
jgi:hypothetical protein